jgi:hypothetical protein
MIINNPSKGMIDYYQTKSQPITRVMVIEAYRKVRANKGNAGIDEMSWADLDNNREAQLYKLWNRLIVMTSPNDFSVIFYATWLRLST